MTNIVGLIGWPVTHSFSPVMHNAAFAALQADWHYVLLPTPADQLEVTIGRIRSGELAGANVTLPYKSAALPFIDEIDPSARAIGAVNTIVKRDGRLIGHNTDTVGFRRALTEMNIDVKGRLCAVLGAGGSARAVIHTLQTLGACVAVYAREAAQAGALVQAGRAHSLLELNDIDQATSLIVNTTPLGMPPRVEASPWPPQVRFPPAARVFDLVYNPAQTQFMAQAERSGLPASNGLMMLIYQGAAAFELWTGRPEPVAVMRQAVSQFLRQG